MPNPTASCRKEGCAQKATGGKGLLHAPLRRVEAGHDAEGALRHRGAEGCHKAVHHAVDARSTSRATTRGRRRRRSSTAAPAAAETPGVLTLARRLCSSGMLPPCGSLSRAWRDEAHLPAQQSTATSGRTAFAPGWRPRVAATSCVGGGPRVASALRSTSRRSSRDERWVTAPASQGGAHPSSPEFLTIQRDGRRRHTPHFVVDPMRVRRPTRLGVTVSSRVGNAVVRNRLKRIVREAVPSATVGHRPPEDVVIIAKPGAERLAEAPAARTRATRSRLTGAAVSARARA